MCVYIYIYIQIVKTGQRQGAGVNALWASVRSISFPHGFIYLKVMGHVWCALSLRLIFEHTKQ